jgi:hypothetical protein
MFDVAVSELSSPRWDLQHEVARAAALGFDAISLWRPKVSDVGAATAAAIDTNTAFAAALESRRQTLLHLKLDADVSTSRTTLTAIREAARRGHVDRERLRLPRALRIGVDRVD